MHLRFAEHHVVVMGKLLLPFQTNFFSIRYSSYVGISRIIADFGVLVSGEGDNTVR
jgi:hypothetical protein